MTRLQTFGYARTSTSDQHNGILSQVQLLEDEAKRRGVSIDIHTEHGSGKSLSRRPVLKQVLNRLDKEGGTLIVTKLDRLARSVIDFCDVVERSRKKKWTLVVLDSLDTTSPQGEAMATMLAAFAQMERRLISERTKSGLAVVKASGKQLGKPSEIPQETIDRIVALQKDGKSLRAIADTLNAEQIPPPKGKQWYFTRVAEVLKRNKQKEETA